MVERPWVTIIVTITTAIAHCDRCTVRLIPYRRKKRQATYRYPSEEPGLTRFQGLWGYSVDEYLAQVKVVTTICRAFVFFFLLCLFSKGGNIRCRGEYDSPWNLCWVLFPNVGYYYTWARTAVWGVVYTAQWAKERWRAYNRRSLLPHYPLTSSKTGNQSGTLFPVLCNR